MSNSQVDRNLLFGILALQIDFVTRDALIAAMSAWVLDKATPLGAILVAQEAVTAQHLDLVEALVAAHLAQHGNDPEKSLAAVNPRELARAKLTKIADPEIQGTLARVMERSRQGGSDELEKTVIHHGAKVIHDGPTKGGSRFVILRPHATGGLGEVFVALDEELNREVALKEIRERFAYDDVSRARFVLEAEITGRLEHPGIVPVYSFGEYDDGRSYYAMRFIQGDSLTTAIKRYHGGLHAGGVPSAIEFRKLLGAFVDVCQAIHYAHSRGVLHRDLKPDNIMLGNFGETLVVDWGLAKTQALPANQTESIQGSMAVQPLRPSMGSGSVETLVGSAVGTPGYMSPEQAGGLPDRLGPASDVYSLGATFYCLLTGQAPFGSTDHVGEVLRRVQKGDFPAPRFVAAYVPRALDAICRKAMALAPEERYPSARDLAEDLEHWLADEPVTAHRESWLPRLARWARRHRPFVAGAAALLITAVVALSAGIVVVDRERQHTLLEQERTKEALEAESTARLRAREALDQMSSTVIEDWLARRQELEPAQKAFLEKALGYYEAFAAETGDREDLRSSVANAYLRIGKIHIQLGQHTDAERAFRRALALYERLASEFPAVPDYPQSLANGHVGMGSLLRDTGQLKEAEEHYRDALAILKQLATDFPDVPAYRQGQARSQVSLANVLRDARPNEAGTVFSDALAIQEQLARDFPAEPAYRMELARTHSNLGALRAMTGRPNEALDAFNASVGILKKLTADFPESPAYREELASCHYGLGLTLKDTSAKRETEQAYRDALAIQKQLAADFPSVPNYRQDLARTHQNLAVLFERGGRSKEALNPSRDALAIKKQLAADFPSVLSYRADLGRSYLNLGINLMGAGQSSEAEVAMNEALAIQRALAKKYPEIPSHQQAVVQSQGFLALLWSGNGEYARAVAEVAELESIPHLSGGQLYDLACVCSKSSAAANNDAKLSSPQRRGLSEQYASRAVTLLSRALANGYDDVANIQKDADLAPLRGRGDFRKLLQQSENSPLRVKK